MGCRAAVGFPGYTCAEGYKLPSQACSCACRAFPSVELVALLSMFCIGLPWAAVVCGAYDGLAWLLSRKSPRPCRSVPDPKSCSVIAVVQDLSWVSPSRFSDCFGVLDLFLFGVVLIALCVSWVFLVPLDTACDDFEPSLCFCFVSGHGFEDELSVSFVNFTFLSTCALLRRNSSAPRLLSGCTFSTPLRQVGCKWAQLSDRQRSGRTAGLHVSFVRAAFLFVACSRHAQLPRSCPTKTRMDAFRCTLHLMARRGTKSVVIQIEGKKEEM